MPEQGIPEDGRRGTGRILPDQIGGRHTFVHEHILVFIAGVTGPAGSAVLSKREIGDALGLELRSVDRALVRLRRAGLIEAVPRFAPTGTQLGNEWRATQEGLAEAMRIALKALESNQ